MIMKIVRSSEMWYIFRNEVDRIFWYTEYCKIVLKIGILNEVSIFELENYFDE